MKASNQALALIRKWERLCLHPYKDIRGVWTVGYGHTRGVAANITITEAMAETLLREDVDVVDTGLNKLLINPLRQNQYDALVDFAFNLGVGAFKGSHLLFLVNQRNYAAAALEFDRWDHVGHVEVSGLLHRREAERLLFLKDEYAT